MSMFVKGDKVAVSDERGNIIFIRPKMPLGIKNRVRDEMTQIGANVGANGQATGSVSVSLNIGAYQIALLKANILGWEGPDFEGMTCNNVNILLLDPDEPLVEKVLREISDRNKKAASPVGAEVGAASPN